MAAESSARQEAWIRENLPRYFPNALIETIKALKGDASTRRFWRIEIMPPRRSLWGAFPPTAIAIDLGPDDLPLYVRTLGLVSEPPSEPPWVTLQRFLHKIDVAVPYLYIVDATARMLLVEDVGSLPLFEAAAQQGDAGDLYRLATDELLKLHLQGTKQLDPACIASRIAYDERLFRWEMEQFVELAPTLIGAGVDRDALASDLDDLAARLGRLPRVLSHRDYHGHNLFIQIAGGEEPRLRVIDFQDALMAPAAQDLAVLLTTRDTSRIIAPRFEQRVLDYYYGALLRREVATLSLNEFIDSYRRCVLQHALKVIGRFTYLESSGKTGYAIYIPYALEQARRMLAQMNDLPTLREALRQ